MRKLPLIVQVPTGIGDFSWVYSKLVTLGCPLEIEVCAGGPPRLQPICDLLPAISKMYTGTIGYGELVRIQKPSNFSLTEIINWPHGVPLPLSANNHIEKGQRIETWLPDMGICHHYEVFPSANDLKIAKTVHNFDKFVCIYASSKATSGTWNGWQGPQWVEFMQLFRAQVAPLPFVLIGAPWDVDLGLEIAACAAAASIPLVNLVAQTPLGASFTIIKDSVYFVSFPSGMGIMAHVLQHPTTMFYPEALRIMLGSYVSPTSDADNLFYETVFIPPAELLQWIIDVYKIKDKL